jgi:hypothetical protein
MKLKIDYSDIIRGTFTPSWLNIMLVMQVNCPGCFLYAIPALTKLYERFAGEMSFYILSTAFEDFDLNTPENTRRLVEQGEMVGATKEALAFYGQDRYEISIPCPVLFDRVLDLPPADHFMSFEKVGYTFAANLLQGTPTFIVFDDSLEVLHKWFGHKYFDGMVAVLEQFNERK